MNATDDQLKAAPEFQYSGRLAAKACINILKQAGVTAAAVSSLLHTN
jgi:hypothetical protein